MEENGTPKLDDKGHQIFTGYCMEFLHEMSKLMNFDYDVILPTDGCKCFGEKLGDGTWTGLIGAFKHTIILSIQCLYNMNRNLAVLMHVCYDFRGLGQ